MIARTDPTLIEYDKIVRDLPALAEVALFLRAQARSKFAIATGMFCPNPFEQTAVLVPSLWRESLDSPLPPETKNQG